MPGIRRRTGMGLKMTILRLEMSSPFSSSSPTSLSIPTFLSLALFGSGRYNRPLSRLLGFQLSCLLYLSQIVLVSVCRGHSTRALSRLITGWDAMGNRSRSLSKNYCISSRREISFRMALVQCHGLSCQLSANPLTWLNGEPSNPLYPGDSSLQEDEKDS